MAAKQLSGDASVRPRPALDENWIQEKQTGCAEQLSMLTKIVFAGGLVVITVALRRQ